MNRVEILDRGSSRTIDISSVAIAGYTGRNRALVDLHIRELAAMGIPGPQTTPVLFTATADRITQEAEIEVVGDDTSGEVEFVIIVDEAGELLVTVGSDHTDRELERSDVAASKQACPKPIGREAWRLTDIQANWDSLELRSWVDGREAPYQEGKFAAIMQPYDIIDFVKTRAPGPLEGVAIFCGTVPISTETFIPSARFRAELFDPISARRLTLEYTVRSLGWRTD